MTRRGEAREATRLPRSGSVHRRTRPRRHSVWELPTDGPANQQHLSRTIPCIVEKNELDQGDVCFSLRMGLVECESQRRTAIGEFHRISECHDHPCNWHSYQSDGVVSGGVNMPIPWMVWNKRDLAVIEIRNSRHEVFQHMEHPGVKASGSNYTLQYPI